MSDIASPVEPVIMDKRDGSSRAEWAILKEIRNLTQRMDKLQETVAEISRDLKSIIEKIGLGS